jgi:hypothetical protein
VDERTEQRFWAKVNKTETCWLWTACLSQGYGRFRYDGETRLAHRVAYEMLAGPIAGLSLDHTCHNCDPLCAGGNTCPHRACVNPAHLEPASHQENAHRSPVLGAKTRCVQGHLYDEANTYTYPGKGSRRCRTCHRLEANKAYHARKGTAA